MFTIQPTPMWMTCVTGFWALPQSKHKDRYENWFATSLRLNCPYVFFGTQETIELAKKFRRELPTTYVKLSLEEFESKSIVGPKFRTDPCHCPSFELGLVWLEKLFLIRRAARMNVFHSDFFCWVDAGICCYRYQAPPEKVFPHPSWTEVLPTDKFIFTSSDDPVFCANNVTETNYYHYVSGTYLLHTNMVHKIVDMFVQFLRHLSSKANNTWTDQVVLTHMYKEYPDMFYKLGHGYGALFGILFESVSKLD